MIKINIILTIIFISICLFGINRYVTVKLANDVTVATIQAEAQTKTEQIKQNGKTTRANTWSSIVLTIVTLITGTIILSVGIPHYFRYKQYKAYIEAHEMKQISTTYEIEKPHL